MYEPLPWLDEIPAHYKDEAWVEARIDQLYDYISHSVKSKHDVYRAVDVLLLLFPQFTNREDLKRWIGTLRDANKAMAWIGADKVESSNKMHHMFTLTTQGKRHIPPRGKRRPRVRTDGRDLFENYLQLLITQIYHQSDWLTSERIDDILELSRVVNDAHLTHKFYQLVGFMYNNRYEFERALDYSRLAYNYFRTKDQDDEIVIQETGLSLFGMAVAHNGKQEHHTAIRYLEQAAELFAKIEFPRQHGIVAQETGCTYYWLKEYETALQWFQIAYKEFTEQEMRFHAANAIQHIGMCQSLLWNLKDAQDNLHIAIDMWRSLDNFHRRLAAEHALAHAEAKAGNKQGAVERLRGVISAVERVPDSEWKLYRVQMAERLIRGIENNENLDSLSLDD